MGLVRKWPANWHLAMAQALAVLALSLRRAANPIYKLSPTHAPA
jgi:hypothetical protein